MKLSIEDLKNTGCFSEIDIHLADFLSSAGGEKSLQSLARSLKLPIATLLYRLERLKQERVLAGARYLIDYSKLGLTTSIHLVSLRGLSPGIDARLLRFCRLCPQISYLVECLGSWDYEVGTVTRSAEELIEIREQLESVLGSSASRVQSLPVHKTIKLSATPF